MFRHFTSPARDVVVRAQHEAVRLRHNYLGKEHLLLALTDEPEGVVAEVFRDFGIAHHNVERQVLTVVGLGPPPSLGSAEAEALETIGIDLDEVRRTIEASFGPGALDMRLTGCGFCFTPRAKEALQLASLDAKGLGHSHIGTEHLLLGLLRSQGGVGADVLRALGLDPGAVRSHVLAKLAQAS